MMNNSYDMYYYYYYFLLSWRYKTISKVHILFFFFFEQLQWGHQIYFCLGSIPLFFQIFAKILFKKFFFFFFYFFFLSLKYKIFFNFFFFFFFFFEQLQWCHQIYFGLGSIPLIYQIFAKILFKKFFLYYINF